MLRAEDIAVHFGGVRAVDGVGMTVSDGSAVGLVGPNGSGKSTLVRALIGLERPASGRVTRRAGLGIGYVPQRLHIDAALPMTVARFLSLPGRVARAAASDALERTGVAGIEDRPLAGLSGGQMQRVLLARALLSRPEILILDEPTQGLDQPGTAAFYRLIEEVRRETGVAVLMVSHDLHVVMSASDRVVCLNHHICCEGAPKVVSAAPEYRALFGLGTGGAFALYRHEHDHDHDGAGDHAHHGHHAHAHEGEDA